MQSFAFLQGSGATVSATPRLDTKSSRPRSHGYIGKVSVDSGESSTCGEPKVQSSNLNQQNRQHQGNIDFKLIEWAMELRATIIH